MHPQINWRVVFPFRQVALLATSDLEQPAS
jgi:hypothetical protein